MGFLHIDKKMRKEICLVGFLLLFFGGLHREYVLWDSEENCLSPDGKYFASTHKAPVGLNIKYAFNMKDYIYIHNIEIGKGINLIEGENPDWIE